MESSNLRDNISQNYSITYSTRWDNDKLSKAQNGSQYGINTQQATWIIYTLVNALKLSTVLQF
jgi:hypothetical protein